MIAPGWFAALRLQTENDDAAGTFFHRGTIDLFGCILTSSAACCRSTIGYENVLKRRLFSIGSQAMQHLPAMMNATESALRVKVMPPISYGWSYRKSGKLSGMRV